MIVVSEKNKTIYLETQKIYQKNIETRLKVYSIDKNLDLFESDKAEINKAKILILIEKYIQKVRSVIKSMDIRKTLCLYHKDVINIDRP